ncbi:MAG: hypothetical protein ACREXY_03725 [Gammaproteobacteria bacterium]
MASNPVSPARPVSVLVEPGTAMMRQVLKNSLDKIKEGDIWSLTLDDVRSMVDYAYNTRHSPDCLESIIYALSCLKLLGDEALFRRAQ